ncbi:sensor domain-containing phosphodiesterase [Tepidiphilus margaritifer]|uniref:sensor domain-containing phosphodiesterase n=1 Tax=Tepidiphilus margaritifer TaxID=203471 RepID=UPI00040F9C3D|nr:EAL domain-containing protein [Tepidiphilus margaritifer]
MRYEHEAPECSELSVRWYRHPEDTTLGYRDWRLMSHFQPIFSIAHGRLVGLEALLRPRHADEDVSALHFFSLTLSPEELAWRDRLARRLHYENFRPLSGDDLWLFVNRVPLADIAAEDELPPGLDPHQVVIELTEGESTDSGLLRELVARYRALGHLVALDDFGARHSNLDRLFTLAPDIVKLDRKLILLADEDVRVRRSLHRLVALIRDTGALVLFEGVETAAQAWLAVEAEADLVQGFHYARPQPRAFALKSTWGAREKLHGPLRAHPRRQHTRRLPEDLDRIFRQTLRRVALGETFPRASAELIARPEVYRAYLLDAHGRQLGHSASRVPLTQLRYLPLADGAGALWSARPYFRRAIAMPGRIHLTDPYLSVPDGTWVRTLSATAHGEAGSFVVCADLAADALDPENAP